MYQRRRVTADQVQKMLLVRPEIEAFSENLERQLEILDPGFVVRQTQLEATPGSARRLPEAEGADACVPGSVSLGLHLQIDAAAMQAALGCWDEDTPCVLKAEFSVGSKTRSLKAISSSGQGVGYNNFLGRSCITLQTVIAPFLERGSLTVKVCLTAEA